MGTLQVNSVLVTGANGFVGRAVSRVLLDTGYSIRCAVRREQATSVLPPDAEAVIVDALSTSSWSAAVQDVDSVIHLIALTHDTAIEKAKDADAYRNVNVSVTQRLLEALQDTRVQRFVYMSSIKAVAEESKPGRPLHETDPPQPEDNYGRTKLQAEKLVREFSASTGVEHTILRPPIVYGTGGVGNMERLAGLVRKGIPLPLGSIKNSRSLIFVENLADAVAATLRHPSAANETFHVADAKPLSTPALIRQMAQAMNHRQRLFPFPQSALQVAGALGRKSGEVRKLTKSLELSTSLIASRIGWEPPTDTTVAIARTFR